MRIRKNRTSSRMVPEFCVAHDSAFAKLGGFRALDPADSGESPQLESSARIGKSSLDAGKVHGDVITAQASPENGCSPIRIRDFVLAHGENATGRCKNVNQQSTSENPSESPSRNQQANGSDNSDGGRATDSSDKTSSRQRSHGKPPKPAPVTRNKVKSGSSSKATAKRRKSDQEDPAESEITCDSPQKLKTMSVTGNGSGVAIAAGRRKRHRSKMEPDSSNMPQKGSRAKSKSEGYAEDEACEPAEAADMEVSSSGNTEKKLKVQEEDRDTGGKDKSPASSSFPPGWSYRGLAQIAEQDKPPQGKQCGRTDGRSWRCPLKVQEGSTLCEHHLSKFRLKKLSKESKRQQLSNRRRQRQQQPQPQKLEEEEEQQEKEQQQEQEREPDGPNSTSGHEENEIEQNSQIPATTEHDAPTRSRRKKRTVKLSVL
ncbi:hypothetical protein R1sor_011612 [Riccia sorocarpa]|uniref:WRC domain-containing protein n=1 Tax=Riccia sorocarpa TaxID=122646 RepID=A0ABD3I2G5_9MARC